MMLFWQSRHGGYYKIRILFSIEFSSQNFFPIALMEAVDTQDGSYAWRSILVGREVLKEGMSWRVGDGTSIWVWSNPWLPSRFLPFISTPRAHGLEDLLVTSLIDSDSNRTVDESMGIGCAAKDQKFLVESYQKLYPM